MWVISDVQNPMNTILDVLNWWMDGVTTSFERQQTKNAKRPSSYLLIQTQSIGIGVIHYIRIAIVRAWRITAFNVYKQIDLPFMAEGLWIWEQI